MARSARPTLARTDHALASPWLRLLLLAAAAASSGAVAGGCSGGEGAAAPDDLRPDDERVEGGAEKDAALGTDSGMLLDPVATHFSSTAIDWSLPSGGADAVRGFYGMTGSGTNAGHETWSTLDLTGDGLPELISTGFAAAAPMAWGSQDAHHWKVFKNTGKGFEPAPTTWPIPEGGVSVETGFFKIANQGGGAAADTWATLDVTGDGLPDLVVTGRGGDGSSAFGTAGGRYWRVFKNNGAGFDKAALTWSVPDGGHGAQRGFSELEFDDRDNSADRVEAWATMDIDGDKRPDLVVTGRGVGTSGVTAWGTGTERHWKVFRNNGGGFEASPQTWSVPVGGLGAARGYWGRADVNTGTGLETWAAADVTGDGRPDLVVTARGLEGAGPAAFGTATARFWNVFKNTGTGFEPTATTWKVPDTGTGLSAGQGFWGLQASGTGPDAESWSTLDLTGDGRADLVVTCRNVDGSCKQLEGAGSRHWKVFPNEGAGFGTTPITWTTPEGGVTTTLGYSGLTGNTFSTAAVSGEMWWTADVNNDRVPDLVVTGRAVDGFMTAWGSAGAQHWKVFPGVP